VSAAESSVPGSILYGVKINVTEPVVATLSFTSEKKAEWEVKRTERRLQEAEQLALDGKLTSKVQKQLASKIEDHIESAKKHFNVIAEKSPEKATEKMAHLEGVLSAHATALMKGRDNGAQEIISVVQLARRDVRTSRRRIVARITESRSESTQEIAKEVTTTKKTIAQIPEHSDQKPLYKKEEVQKKTEPSVVLGDTIAPLETIAPVETVAPVEESTSNYLEQSDSPAQNRLSSIAVTSPNMQLRATPSLPNRLSSIAVSSPNMQFRAPVAILEAGETKIILKELTVSPAPVQWGAPVRILHEATYTGPKVSIVMKRKLRAGFAFDPKSSDPRCTQVGTIIRCTDILRSPFYVVLIPMWREACPGDFLYFATLSSAEGKISGDVTWSRSVRVVCP